MTTASGNAGGGVLLLAASLGGGGAERQLVDMANHWTQRGVAVTLATFSGRDVPDFFPVCAGVRRVHLRNAGEPSGVWPLVRAVRALVRDSRPGAIVCFIAENNIIALLATFRLPVRLIVSERAHPQYDTTVRAFWRVMRRFLYRRAYFVVAQTRETAEWVETHCGARVCVIPNALRVFAEADQPREPLVLGVGRLTRQKGFDLLLEAFARLATEFPRWRVAILGEGPERAALGAASERLGIAHAVDFPGTERDIQRWMSRAGLVVQPSRFEGFPNVVLEAMGLGAAVISADCPAGPRDLIDDGVNGRLVPVEDIDALCGAMRDLMSDAAARERLGSQARKVRDAFSQEKIMTKWDSIVLDPAPVAGTPA